ncbi:valine--tRNA ligase [Prochlorococcus sp. MIT 1341]|uniref:valine--tRNA ligase n=1 Tax=Prochlorococcus sp. MIT 1341 TaxID=3096221 RepID=UPI002A757536|nr:valine--tRNA ligase [Prochlorococcus sp. MIT 1341]
MEKETSLPKTYDPVGTENRWQNAWEENGAFHPEANSSAEPFCVVIPPPNVTGTLHMGHAFNTALIDTIVRFQRLQGKNVLCLPGTDHASIAVQTLLEKQLKKENIDCSKLGRDFFLKRAWAWKAESGGNIVRQLRRLGYSVDWERERFTLDEGLSKAVREAFIRLHDLGLIYRGEYLVNWCPASGSAVSDLEVEMKEIDGFLWHFRYPLKEKSDHSNYIEVATTRPETLLGDTAVAVNPSDERYKHLIGKTLIVPFLNREIPLIADNHVDKEFGTGCVKVTPAHDPNDFAIGQRHQLPQINIMNKDGSMNKNAGRFAGLERFEARKAVIQALEDSNLLIEAKPHRHNVPYSERGKVPVEPLLSTQWFVRMEPIASKTRDHLEKREPNFVPKRWEKVYRNWLLDIRDWCISRQLWWGHRIPAWFVVSETKGEVTNATPYVIAHSTNEALIKAKKKFGESCVIQQDEDVLDTWFSSGLWPFSTLGWPDESNDDLSCWFPTSTLVTGFDIIFFWVARMTMLSVIFTKKIPFKDVYIHGLVRDEKNQKMSKSAGNGIDPLLLIERYGADALRFALVREVAGAGQDIRLDYDRNKDTSITVEASRNFANKLWNATRFVLLQKSHQNEDLDQIINPDDLKLSDRWILSRLATANQETCKRYQTYNLGEAAKGLYEFAWNDFCDWYLELIKKRINPDEKESLKDQKIAQKILHKVLTELLIMLNPLMPHLTEELWHSITNNSHREFLSLQAWPVLDKSYIDTTLEESFENIIGAIRVIRNLRALAELKPSLSAPVRLVTPRKEIAKILKEAKDEIKNLTRASKIEILDPEELKNNPSNKALAGVTGDLQVLLLVDGSIDLSALHSRLEKDITKAEKDIKNLSSRLNNKNFTSKAPKEIINECKAKLTEAQTQAALAKKRLSDLS